VLGHSGYLPTIDKCFCDSPDWCNWSCVCYQIKVSGKESNISKHKITSLHGGADPYCGLVGYDRVVSDIVHPLHEPCYVTPCVVNLREEKSRVSMTEFPTNVLC
jgi:hypothetical protein